MLNRHICLLWPAAVLASLAVEDPSNVINPKFWKSDNALVADYDIAFVSVQPEASIRTSFSTPNDPMLAITKSQPSPRSKTRA
jgi:hypothetical protein